MTHGGPTEGSDMRFSQGEYGRCCLAVCHMAGWHHLSSFATYNPEFYPVWPLPNKRVISLQTANCMFCDVVQFAIVCIIVSCLWSTWPSLGLQPDFCFPYFVARLFVTEQWTFLRGFIPTGELKCSINVKIAAYRALL